MQPVGRPRFGKRRLYAAVILVEVSVRNMFRNQRIATKSCAGADQPSRPEIAEAQQAFHTN